MNYGIGTEIYIDDQTYVDDYRYIYICKGQHYVVLYNREVDILFFCYGDKIFDVVEDGETAAIFPILKVG